MDKRMIQIPGLQETQFKHTSCFIIKRCKEVYYAKGIQKRAEVGIPIQNKIDLKVKNSHKDKRVQFYNDKRNNFFYQT